MSTCIRGTCGNTMDAPIVRNSGCPDKLGCDPNLCPDFYIRRNDSLPPFKVLVEDCDGPLDLEGEGIVAEANMWAKAKLKTAITAETTEFRLADDIGFEQIMVGDIIIMERIRAPEHMIVLGFDEVNMLVKVNRGYNATLPRPWKKGTKMRIFRILNAPASIEMIKQDITSPDGSTEEDVLTDTFIRYDWDTADTCLPGCYWFEFKVLKEEDTPSSTPLPSTTPSLTPSVIPSLTPSVTPSVIPSLIPSQDIACGATGLEWIRRFPVKGEGFLIQIIDSPTVEP